MKKTAFTLLEAIFAIFVLLLTIGGASTLLQRILAFTPTTYSKLVASYLAEEGMEIVKNIRDTNWLEGANWDDGIPASPPTYGVDYQTQTLPDINCSNEGYLAFDGNLYSCSANPNSEFQRKITIEKIGTDEIKVIVKVSWKEKGGTQEIKAIEYLYRWFY